MLSSGGPSIKVAERDTNITINLATPPLAYPTPTEYQWTRTNVPVTTDSRVTYTYPSVFFSSIERGDSGTYGLMATNHRTDNGVAIGTGQGSFTLDVLCKFWKGSNYVVASSIKRYYTCMSIVIWYNIGI